MKQSLVLLLCLGLLFNCKENSETIEEIAHEKADAKLSLEGAWEMIGYYNYKDNKIVDSFKTREGHRQVKIYTKSKVMWSKLVPNDSTEWFGYGSYTLNDSTLLVEVMDYGSKMMNTVIVERKKFEYQLKLKQDKYSQIEIDEDGNLVYSENYVRIE